MVKTGTVSHPHLKYGFWTIGSYILVYLLFLVFRPTLWNFLEQHVGALIWAILLQLLPFMVGFIFLITGYAALKGDRTQIFPAIVHAFALITLLTGIFQARLIFM